MKKLLCLLLGVSLLCFLFGCSSNAPQVPAEFFYRQNGFPYDTQRSVIGSEIRETIDHPGYLRTLNLYLQGPASNDFSPTYPEDSKIITLSQSPGAITLVLSDAFASLTGIELSIACTCLTQTVIQLTGCTVVTIQAESLPLDGKSSITLNESSAMLYDNYYGQIESE